VTVYLLGSIFCSNVRVGRKEGKRKGGREALWRGRKSIVEG